MADKSSIEWTDATWNPLAGCTKVSPGCANCYAEVMARRLKAMGNINYQGVVDDKGRWSGQIALIPSVLDKPLHWKRPRKIFVDSMSDLFHPTVPSGYIRLVFQAMLEANWHIFQVLTKRPERMSEILNRVDWWAGTEPEARKHIWLGTSVEDQKRADERIPELLRAPAAVRFLSCEPLLGPVDLTKIPISDSDATMNVLRRASVFAPHVNWVIVGGESGHKARPMHPLWAESLRDQCIEDGVPFLFKQWGEWHYDGDVILERPDTPVMIVGNQPMYRVGKHTAGRLLDGRTWDEYPR